MQTDLKNGLWELVGFMGHPSALSSSTYREDSTREVIDIADTYTSFLAKENSLESGQLAYVLDDGTFSSSYVVNTNPLKASIGIFAIKNSVSKSGKTILSSKIDFALKLKVSEAKIYLPHVPKYRMYIEGKNNPIARIDYQANYEGVLFRVKVANETEDYICYFDSSKTYDHPAELEDSSLSLISNEALSTNIRDVVDFSAQDNNLSKMLIYNKFEIKDGLNVYNKDLRDFKSSIFFDVIAYRFSKEGRWELFNSKNVASSNQFDNFEVGKGYWVKIDNALSTMNSSVKTALISRDSVNIDTKEYANMKNGWNLLSFNDAYIRYAPTAVFIPQDLFVHPTSSGVTIYSKPYSTNSSIHSTALTSDYTNSRDAARIINIFSQAKSDVYGNENTIRGVPAIRVQRDSTETIGIIVIADEIFELNTSGNITHPIVSLAGEDIKNLANSAGYSSIYGEYFNFIGTNELNGTEINASLAIKMPKYNSSYQFTYDLNDSNKTKNLANVLIALNNTATKSGETTASTKTAGYLSTFNFNASDDYNISNNMNAIVLAAGERYLVYDNTHIRVHKFNKNGKFRIKSSFASIDIKVDNDENNITKVINAINARKFETNVVATYLGIDADGDEQFMISSTKDGLELLEDDSYSLFDDLSLGSSGIINPNISQGFLVAYHSSRNLFTPIVFNKGAIDGAGYIIPKVSTGITVTVGAPVYTGGIATYTGNLNIGGSLTIASTQKLEVYGDLIVGGALFVDGELIVGSNIDISGAILINNGGSIVVGRNGTLDGNLLVDSESTIFVEGDLVTTGGTIPVADNIIIGGIHIPPGVHTPWINDLDLNVSGVPVGLFDLSGQDFPSLNQNIGKNPLSTLDFPISGGLIENLYDNDKEIKNIMTIEYSGNNKGYWRITDLSKDIDTLYGNSYNANDEFDNDTQGIFHIHPNKSYWINVKPANKALRPNSLISTIDKANSGITPQVSTHFSNTLDKGKSITRNHINHRLNIKFKDDSKFINTRLGDADYYNVVASIAGERFYLRRSGNYFSLNIDNNEIPIKETNIDNTIPIIIEAYDGTGLTLKDDKNNANFSIKFFKPEIPQLEWDNNGDLIIDSKNKQNIDNNISILEIYSPNISDIKSQRQKALLSENNLTKNKKDEVLKWNYGDSNDLYGGLRAMKTVIKDKKYEFYSDIRAFIYAPLKQGHILSVNQSNVADDIPYSYISNKELANNSGVQLDLLKNITTIQLAYFPQGAEGAKSLSGTGFGGSKTMFLRLNSGITSQDAIAKITYIPSYDNKIFYIYVNNKLYQGRFSVTNDFNSDNNAYNLQGKNMSVDILTLSGATQTLIGANEGIVVISGTKNIQNIEVR